MVITITLFLKSKNMKKFIYTLAMILGVGFLSTSCSEDYLDELTGKYVTPEAKQFTTATYTRTQDGNVFHYAVKLSNGSETLNIEFVDDKWFLTETTFYNHAAAGAVKGHFVKETTSFNGTACANENGMVFVKKSGDNYTIDGNVWLSDGRIIHATWSGVLTFEEVVVEPTPLNFGGGADWTGFGGNSIALGFSVEPGGIAFSWDSFGFVTNGSGFSFSVEFTVTDGAIAPGTYTASAAAGAGKYFNGKVNNAGVTTLTAPITVAKNGDTYTITTTIDGVDYVYNGPIAL